MWASKFADELTMQELINSSVVNRDIIRDMAGGVV